MPRQLIHHHRLFLAVPTSLYIVVGAPKFPVLPSGSETLFLTVSIVVLGIIFFVIVTKVVEAGLLYIGLALLIWRVRYFVMYLIDTIVLAIIVHVLKHQVFAINVRPSMFFGPTQTLHFVAGVPVFRIFTVPRPVIPQQHLVSHFCWLFLSDSTWASMLFLGIAMLVGISRISIGAFLDRCLL
jgi:hypothetical protein